MSDSQIPRLPPAEEDLSALDDQSNIIDWVLAQPPWLIGVVVVAFIAAVILGVLAFRPKSDDVVVTPDPTALAALTPPAGALMLDSGVPHPQFSVPISMTVKGLAYDVLSQEIKSDGDWLFPPGLSGKAVWVYGTIVNFVIGLEHTTGNVALLESLAVGDQISMTTTGGIYQFGFAGREKFDPTNSSLFEQPEPGLTLVSLGAADQERWVVFWEYQGLEDGVEQATGHSVAVGEPALLVDVRVTVMGTSYMYEGPDVPEGWAYYLIDYQIENLSENSVLDPNRLRMELQDGIGAMYSLNLPASELGSFGYLMLTVPPRTVAQGPAGYLVPAPLQGPKLSWTFSRLDTPESVVKVLIDFQNPEQVIDQRLFSAVDLAGAELSSDQTLLSVWGTVLNNSDEPLIVAVDDVTLQGRDSEASLRSADPALPWTIEPGSVVSFRLTYQRPADSTVTFTVLNHPFEIGGLP